MKRCFKMEKDTQQHTASKVDRQTGTPHRPQECQAPTAPTSQNGAAVSPVSKITTQQCSQERKQSSQLVKPAHCEWSQMQRPARVGAPYPPLTNTQRAHPSLHLLHATCPGTHARTWPPLTCSSTLLKVDSSCCCACTVKLLTSTIS
jgi:hypothetical protein